MAEDDIDDVGDVIHAADAPPPEADRAAEEPERRSEPSLRPAVVTLAIASLAVAGGAAYLVFRRRRRGG